MKYRSIAIPEPAQGADFSKCKELTVPDQSMSLLEILNRFTRNEPLAVGKEATYDEDSDVDLEKIAKSDLVDRQEYVEKLKETQRKYEKQEKKKAEEARIAARLKIEAEEREKLAKQKEGEKPSGSA